MRGSAVLAGWLAGLAGACGGAPERGLELLEFRQQDFASVALNEELVFYFSEDLDRASITSDSVRITDAAGADVSGTREVRGDALSFLPDLPCSSDLSDGGLSPGTAYHVTLGGFPRPDGIRGVSGALLSASLQLEFRTAEVGATNSPLFLDPFLGPFRLMPGGKRPHPMEFEDGRIVLEYGEALDPSVPGSSFELLPPGWPDEPKIPVAARLVENRRNRAVLLLEPTGADFPARLPPGRYNLLMTGRELRTLGQREVEPGWGPRGLEIIVPEVRTELDFATQRSNDPPPTCDGTALSGEHGPGLRLRYPAAAGNGLAGVVELAKPPSGSDLQAQRLSVPASAEVDLSQLTGPVVLRSQTSLEIRGRLTRRGSGTRMDPLTLELERLDRLPPEHEASRTSLSAWLAGLLDPEQSWKEEPWTVLIAGGDIRVPAGGSIEVDGPLVLVAGGWIRVDGKATAYSHVWKTSDGGGGVVSDGGRNRPLPLRLDEPEVNPLRTAFRAGALTLEMPWTPRQGAWRLGFTGLEGGGRIRAEFLELVPGETRTRRVADPGELTTQRIRVLVLLELGPGHGEAWDPPRLERLRLEAVPAPSFDARDDG
jgi:hypothetical protein